MGKLNFGAITCLFTAICVILNAHKPFFKEPVPSLNTLKISHVESKIKIAVLDDYQQVARQMADWSLLDQQCDITVFDDHLSGEDTVIDRLRPFEVVCVMRERTPLTRNVLVNLPQLKLIVSTGARNASIDARTAEELGITIKHTRYVENGAPELTWALLMALARKLDVEFDNMRTGGWQTTVGVDLTGKTIGLIGLGRVGSKMAAYARAFGMNVIAWSPHLTEERAAIAGATLVSKDELFSRADFISVHLVLSDSTRKIVSKADLLLMKHTAFFINTSRGPLVDEGALAEILRDHKIAGAALDVYGEEPLPAHHPFRTLPNVLATAHIGYVTENTYRVFYGDTVKAIHEWLQHR